MNHDTNWANDEKSEGQNEKRATENEIYSYIIYLFFILNSKSKNIYVQSGGCVPPFNFIIPLIYFGTLKSFSFLSLFSSVSSVRTFVFSRALLLNSQAPCMQSLISVARLSLLANFFLPSKPKISQFTFQYKKKNGKTSFEPRE